MSANGLRCCGAGNPETCLPPCSRMTEPDPAPETYRVSGYNPQPGGCTEPTCRSQNTVSLDGRFGRRCWQHSPWRTLAAEGRVTEAWAALRAWLGTRGAA